MDTPTHTEIEQAKTLVRSTEVDEFAAATELEAERLALRSTWQRNSGFKSEADYQYSRDIEDRARGDR